jgi:prepilin-type N-terminal cleavage/methylation domain-containing protein
MKGKFDVKSRIEGTKGLTIIELIVVMCILAVMVVIAIPNIGRWLPRYRLRSAVRDVACNWPAWEPSRRIKYGPSNLTQMPKPIPFGAPGKMA